MLDNGVELRREIALDQAIKSSAPIKASRVIEIASIFESYLLNGREAELPPDGYEVLAPECFTNGKVIAYKGENYYKACDALVMITHDGEQVHCVKRVGHPSLDHEDYHGNVRRSHK